jgi:hypothetical protein
MERRFQDATYFIFRKTLLSLRSEFLNEKIHSCTMHITEHMFRVVLLFILYFVARNLHTKVWHFSFPPGMVHSVTYDTLSFRIFQLT